jgi:hypothetical protein
LRKKLHEIDSKWLTKAGGQREARLQQAAAKAASFAQSIETYIHYVLLQFENGRNASNADVNSNAENKILKRKRKRTKRTQARQSACDLLPGRGAAAMARRRILAL